MKIKIAYTQQGDYLLPDLILPEQSNVKIGIWGRKHERYIKKYHKLRYFNLLTSCTLTAYLADIDSEATEMYDSLVQQLAKQEDITEQLKSEDLMLWVRYVNNIRNRATEIVYKDLIYV